MNIGTFQQIVWKYYNDHARVMPWRTNTDPYFVLVSEIMLQQTQVTRVLPKFETFVHSFPTVVELSKAPLSEVLQAWSGLGYNRRAKFLHTASQQIVSRHNGQIPSTLQELIKLPGIGHNTAAAILAYAYNQPVVFIETNVRSVILHHFFPNDKNVDDKLLLPIVEASVDRSNPREWYWALMDYGSHLKSQYPNPSRRSRHHATQSKFEGSDRQLRGKILKLLLSGPMDTGQLFDKFEDDRTPQIVDDLFKEGFITILGGTVKLSS